MKHDELWQDMLHDALPPGAATAALEAMRREGRRQRTRRRVIKAGSSIALLLVTLTAATLWTRSTAPPAITSLPVQQTASSKIKTHQLTDAELVARLKAANLGIIIAHQDGGSRLLLVPQ